MRNNINYTWYAEDGNLHKNCVVFFKTKDTFGALSNMAGGYLLKINEIDIFSAEALYQACRFPHQLSWQAEIISKKNPVGAKIVAKQEGRSKQDSRHDWLENRENIMKWVLQVKLAQHYDSISKLLLQTGEKAIVEKSREDRFWGAVEESEGHLHGCNRLGQLWMELRELVKTKSREEFMVVKPLDISNFLLLGQPIYNVRGVVF